MSQLEIFRCAECEEHVFPERLRCPGCGARSFEPVPAGPGRVEEQTALRREGVTLASVRLAKGPVVVIRLEGQVRGEVTLEQHADGAITNRRA